MKGYKFKGSVVKVHKVDDIMWVKGMDKYDGEIAEVLQGITYGPEKLYILKDCNGSAGVPYLFPEDSLEEV